MTLLPLPVEIEQQRLQTHDSIITMIKREIAARPTTPEQRTLETTCYKLITHLTAAHNRYSLGQLNDLTTSLQRSLLAVERLKRNYFARRAK